MITLLLLFLVSASAQIPLCTLGVKEMCDPCHMAPLNPPLCEKWKNSCIKTICTPMCTRLTWGVDIKPKTCSGNPSCGEFSKSVNSESVQLALKAHLLAHGCAHMADCCEDNDSLKQYIEHRTYGGYFPEALLPIPVCHRADANLCSMCKAAVDVSVSGKSICDKYPEPVSPPEGRDANFGHSKVQVKPQVPKHGSFKKKCLKVSVIMTTKFVQMKLLFKEQLCKCLGCCASSGNPCFFPPVTYSSVEDALKESPKHYIQLNKK